MGFLFFWDALYIQSSSRVNSVVFFFNIIYIKVQNNLSKQCVVFKVVISFGKIVIFLSRYRKIYSQLLNVNIQTRTDHIYIT